jgi:tRNA A37 methylthiotransferase MiaB
MNKKKYLQTFINKEVNVLFEHNKEKNVQIGHSEYSFIVKVNTKKSLWNELRKVKIIKMTNNDLFGVLL